MSTPNAPPDSQMERAKGGEGESRLQVEISKEFLRYINVISAKRGLSNRDFVIQAILKDSVEEEF